MRALRRFESAFGPEAVDQLRDWLAHELRVAGVSSDLAYSVLTLADEVCCNVLEHSDAHWLELGLEAGGANGAIGLQVRDDGSPFDPTRALPPAEGAVVQPGQDRKLGLYMMSRLGEHLKYRREGGVNELRLTLRETVD